jgi:hypothetical protein
MTTLNARANQAWAAVAFEVTDIEAGFDHQRAAFEEGWETGFTAARTEVSEQIAVTVAEFLGQPAGPIAAEIARKLGRGEKL